MCILQSQMTADTMLVLYAARGTSQLAEVDRRFRQAEDLNSGEQGVTDDKARNFVFAAHIS